MGVSLRVYIQYVWDISFRLRSYVYGLLMMWLTGPKWDGDPLTPPLSRLGPLAPWSVIHHPLGLLPPTLYPVATAMLTAAALSKRTGTDTEMGIETHTLLILTGLAVRASSTDTSTMHYYQQVRTSKHIYHTLWNEYHKTWVSSRFSCIFNISTLSSHVQTNRTYSGSIHRGLYTYVHILWRHR